MKGLLFTYLLTYGGAGASLFNPWIGLLVYVCFAIIKPEALWYWSVPAGNYSRIVALGLLAGWIVNGCRGLQHGLKLTVTKALLGFLAWSCASTCFAPHIDVALQFDETLVKIVLPFVVGVSLVDDVRKLKQLAWVIALSQGYVALEMNQAYYAGFNRVTEVGFAGMDNNCLAIAMVAGTGLAFFLGLGARKWWQKLIALLAAALMAHCVMFSFSRGGMLGLIVTGITAFFLIPKQPKHYVLFALAVLLALRLAGPQVIERFVTTFADKETRDGSAQSRVEMWGYCLEIMAQRPLLGIGPDQFPLVATQFGLPFGKEAHTLWLQVGAELGVPGLGFLLAFYGICIVQLWRLLGRTANIDPSLADAARMVIASLVGFSVSAQFVSLEGLELPYYVAIIGAGAIKLSSLERPDAAPVAVQSHFAY